MSSVEKLIHDYSLADDDEKAELIFAGGDDHDRTKILFLRDIAVDENDDDLARKEAITTASLAARGFRQERDVVVETLLRLAHDDGDEDIRACCLSALKFHSLDEREFDDLLVLLDDGSEAIRLGVFSVIASPATDREVKMRLLAGLASHPELGPYAENEIDYLSSTDSSE